MIDFLIYLLILLIVFGLLYYIIMLLPLPEPFKKIAQVVVLVLFLLVVLSGFLGLLPPPRWK
jgi:hypothetical protein